MKTQLSIWKEFYADVFPGSWNLSVPFARSRRNSDTLIVVPKNLTISIVLGKCREHFHVNSCYSDINTAIAANARGSEVTYGIWVRAGEESIIKLRGKSASELKAMRVNGITLLERVVIELIAF